MQTSEIRLLWKNPLDGLQLRRIRLGMADDHLEYFFFFFFFFFFGFYTGVVQLSWAGLPLTSCFGSLGHLLWGVYPTSIFVGATCRVRTHAETIQTTSTNALTASATATPPRICNWTSRYTCPKHALYPTPPTLGSELVWHVGDPHDTGIGPSSHAS